MIKSRFAHILKPFPFLLIDVEQFFSYDFRLKTLVSCKRAFAMSILDTVTFIFDPGIDDSDS